MLARWEDAVAAKCKLNFYLKKGEGCYIFPSCYGFITLLNIDYMRDGIRYSELMKMLEL